MIVEGELDKQLERLLEKERIARTNSDHQGSVAILTDIVTLCYQAKSWKHLHEQIQYLMNRRGQGKKAQVSMIQLVMTWLPEIEEPHRTTLIQTIKQVCAKKIFLEVQYARCILMIVKTKENDNDIMEAAKILQEVQVETYGSMGKREKLQFILYQMKIMLKKEDYVRFYIISKKINENNINDEDIADIKVLFYSYMTLYYTHESDFQQCCRAYRIIWQTLKTTKKIIPQILDYNFSTKIDNILSNYVGFLTLQPYSVSTYNQMQQLLEKPEIEQSTHCHHILKSFLSGELASCDIRTYTTDNFELFTDGFQNSKKHLEELKRMLVQHNIRIISKYYGQLTLSRMSQLVGADKSYCEEQLCTLNNKHVVACRIDRIDDTIDFRPVENENYLLQNFNTSINKILDMVDITANLIHREREVFKK